MSAQLLHSAKAAEVRWGTGQEAEIIARWLEATGRNGRVAVVPSVCSSSFFDGLILSKATGLPVGFLEVKARRIAWADYRDTIWPQVKWEKAMRAWDDHSLVTLAVVQYTDALIQVRLNQDFDWLRDVTRTDRGYPVPHVGFNEHRHAVVG